jgi:multicomponent K+:H+ antiporter subunit G
MSHLETLPVWAAVLIAFFVVLGSALTLLGTVGLIYLKSFYDRMHAPTLGTSWGTAGIVIASMILFSMTRDRAIVHEFLIGAFIMITTPVTLLLLGRAALHRDRVENSATLPDVAKSKD